MKIDVPVHACEQKGLDELSGGMLVVAPLYERGDDRIPRPVSTYALYYIYYDRDGGRTACLLSNSTLHISLDDVSTGNNSFMTVNPDKLVISLHEETPKEKPNASL